MPARTTREPITPGLHPVDLNAFIGIKNSHLSVYPATLAFSACLNAGSKVSWERLVIFGAVRSNWYSVSLNADLFASETEGSIPDQLVNAVLRWEPVDDLSELPGTSEETLKQFDAAWETWTRWRANLITSRRPAPIEPKPEPKPVPPPAPKPVPPPVPAPVPPPAPEKPAEPGAWKKSLHWVSFAANVLLMAYFVWSAALPAPVAGIIKMALEFLKEFFK